MFVPPQSLDSKVICIPWWVESQLACWIIAKICKFLHFSCFIPAFRPWNPPNIHHVLLAGAFPIQFKHSKLVQLWMTMAYWNNHGWNSMGSPPSPGLLSRCVHSAPAPGWLILVCHHKWRFLSWEMPYKKWWFHGKITMHMELWSWKINL